MSVCVNVPMSSESPSSSYGPEYWLQPVDPLTCPAENTALGATLAGNVISAPEVSTHGVSSSCDASAPPSPPHPGASPRRTMDETAKANRTNGEGGIRTLDAGVHPRNALAGRRLQPLGHFST